MFFFPFFKSFGFSFLPAKMRPFASLVPNVVVPLPGMIDQDLSWLSSLLFSVLCLYFSVASAWSGDLR